MNMSAIVQIDGVEQFTSNYEVGVFVGDECRASAIGLPTPFNNHYVLSLLIYGTTGESFTFRLYDHATETELTPDLNSPAAVSFNTDGYGSPVDPYVLNFTSTIAMVSQTFSLNSGWNWWSTYVELSNMDGLDLLEEGLGTNGKTINSQADGSAMYLSGSWMNGIGHNLNNENMFQIELSNAVDFTLSGPLADPSDHEITLANGWNWIGYPVNQTLTVANALAKASDFVRCDFAAEGEINWEVQAFFAIVAFNHFFILRRPRTTLSSTKTVSPPTMPATDGSELSRTWKPARAICITP